MAKSTRRKLKKDDPIFAEGPQAFVPVTRPARTVELLHMNASDVNGGQFEWSAELERGEDGVVYLALIPPVDEGENIELPDPVAIEEGSLLFDQLRFSWNDYAGEFIRELTWREIASKVAKFDKALGAGLEGRLREEYEYQPGKPSAATQWARGAKWDQGAWGGAGGMNSAFQNGLRAIAARHFAEKHRRETGLLPSGRHLVSVNVGPKGSGADIEPPIGSTAQTLSFEAVFPDGEYDQLP